MGLAHCLSCAETSPVWSIAATRLGAGSDDRERDVLSSWGGLSHGAANIESRETVGEASPRRFTKRV